MKTPSIWTAMGWNPTGDFGALTVYTQTNKVPVFFMKAPPKTPATVRQRYVRDLIGYFGRRWTELPRATKDTWERASKLANLRMTGYNLFQWWCWHRDVPVMRTIEHQSGCKLLT